MIDKRIAKYRELIKAGRLTINEARALEGLPGIGPAGDVAYVPQVTAGGFMTPAEILPWRTGVRKQFSLTFDRNYGISRRTGWTVVYDGSVIEQFVSFRRALWLWLKLCCGWRPWEEE